MSGISRRRSFALFACYLDRGIVVYVSVHLCNDTSGPYLHAARDKRAHWAYIWSVLLANERRPTVVRRSPCSRHDLVWSCVIETWNWSLKTMATRQALICCCLPPTIRVRSNVNPWRIHIASSMKSLCPWCSESRPVICSVCQQWCRCLTRRHHCQMRPRSEDARRK